MIVRLGEWDAGTDLDCDPNSDPEDPDCAEPVQDISVKSYLAHPDFERQTVFNDIGIIQLAEGAKIGNRNIKPICLPFSPELHTLPRTLVVIGWGRTESSPRSSILQKAAVPLFGQADCIKKFTGKRKFSLIDGQFCAGGEGMFILSDFSILLLNSFQKNQEKSTLAKAIPDHPFNQSAPSTEKLRWSSSASSLTGCSSVVFSRVIQEFIRKLRCI